MLDREFSNRVVAWCVLSIERGRCNFESGASREKQEPGRRQSRSIEILRRRGIQKVVFDLPTSRITLREADDVLSYETWIWKTGESGNVMTELQHHQHGCVETDFHREKSETYGPGKAKDCISI